MTDFYEEMAQMVDEMLAGTSQGGLGQGTIVLIRQTLQANELEPWNPPTVTRAQETLKAVASAVENKAGSSSYPDGTTVIDGDILITAAVPRNIPWTLGGDAQSSMFIRIDGSTDLPVLHVTTIPEAGTPVAVKFYVRGPKV